MSYGRGLTRPWRSRPPEGALHANQPLPDPTTQAPTPVTAFFASAPKVAAVALLVRVAIEALGPATEAWRQIVSVVAIASILWGAFAAIGQTNIKRLMAYSSIGHVGYALVGLSALIFHSRREQGTKLSVHVETLDRDLIFFLVFFTGGIVIGSLLSQPRYGYSSTTYVYDAPPATLGNCVQTTGTSYVNGRLAEYAGAWRDRVLENGGNIPTNIGLDGAIYDDRYVDGTRARNYSLMSSAFLFF